jgi:hypothetical protein
MMFVRFAPLLNPLDRCDGVVVAEIPPLPEVECCPLSGARPCIFWRIFMSDDIVVDCSY